MGRRDSDARGGAGDRGGDGEAEPFDAVEEAFDGSLEDAMDGATDCAWGMFQDALIMGIRQIDPGGRLVLVAPAGLRGLASQLVLRADLDSGAVWVTWGIAGSTAAEEVVCRGGEPADLAQAIVRVAREDLRLPHPQLFTARVLGPGAARLADALRVTVTADEEIPDDLRPLAAAVIARVFGAEPEVDDDGDLTFLIGGTRAWLAVLPGGGLVRITAPVVRNVYSRRTAAVEVGLLNRNSVCSMWFTHNRDVFLRNTIPAHPLSADNLEGMLREFADEMSGKRDDLAYRLGGVLI